MALLATACAGELEPLNPSDPEPPTPPPSGSPDAGVPEPTGDDPSVLFSTNVQPIVARCAGEACHTGVGTPLKFLGSPSPDDDYESITAFPSVTGNFQPALANMLLKIDAGGHYGQSYTQAERDAIVAWLQAESRVRADADDDGEPDPPPASTNAFAEWSGCMTKANWDAAQMGDWADKRAEGGDTCSTCHADGAFRFNTNPTNDTMFTMNRTELYIIGFFTVKVNADGSQQVIPAYDKLERMGNGSTLHPRFDYGPDDPYFQRLAEFHQLTEQTKLAGQCGPAQFPTP
ncbi:MAG: hypothetical protein D6689_12505 [Deltaproteobacteria bacterium]|nr:MAG: hypothetical protein D6689_12505 [Deltaproteobacteria bacterium]